MVFVPPGGVRCENYSKLEFDDPLNEIARCSRPQAFPNELKLGKRAEKMPTESREETTVRYRASKERSGAKSRLPGGVAEIPGYPPGGGPSDLRACV